MALPAPSVGAQTAGDGRELNVSGNAVRRFQMAWLKKADQQQASDGVPPKPLTAETPLEVQNEFNKEIPEPVDEAPFCPACGGPGIHMGNLGNRAHFRCRDCGIDFSNEG